MNYRFVVFFFLTIGAVAEPVSKEEFCAIRIADMNGHVVKCDLERVINFSVYVSEVKSEATMDAFIEYFSIGIWWSRVGGIDILSIFGNVWMCDQETSFWKCYQESKKNIISDVEELKAVVDAKKDSGNGEKNDANQSGQTNNGPIDNSKKSTVETQKDALENIKTQKKVLDEKKTNNEKQLQDSQNAIKNLSDKVAVVENNIKSFNVEQGVEDSMSDEEKERIRNENEKKRKETEEELTKMKEEIKEEFEKQKKLEFAKFCFDREKAELVILEEETAEFLALLEEMEPIKKRIAETIASEKSKKEQETAALLEQQRQTEELLRVKEQSVEQGVPQEQREEVKNDPQQNDTEAELLKKQQEDIAKQKAVDIAEKAKKDVADAIKKKAIDEINDEISKFKLVRGFALLNTSDVQNFETTSIASIQQMVDVDKITQMSVDSVKDRIIVDIKNKITKAGILQDAEDIRKGCIAAINQIVANAKVQNVIVGNAAAIAVIELIGQKAIAAIPADLKKIKKVEIDAIIKQVGDDIKKKIEEEVLKCKIGKLALDQYNEFNKINKAVKKGNIIGRKSLVVKNAAEKLKNGIVDCKNESEVRALVDEYFNTVIELLNNTKGYYYWCKFDQDGGVEQWIGYEIDEGKFIVYDFEKGNVKILKEFDKVYVKSLFCNAGYVEDNQRMIQCIKKEAMASMKVWRYGVEISNDNAEISKTIFQAFCQCILLQ